MTQPDKTAWISIQLAARLSDGVNLFQQYYSLFEIEEKFQYDTPVFYVKHRETGQEFVVSIQPVEVKGNDAALRSDQRQGTPTDGLWTLDG